MSTNFSGMATKEVVDLLSEARTFKEADPEKALAAATKAEAVSKDDKAGAMDALCALVLVTVAKGEADEALKLAEDRLASAMVSGDASKEVGAMLALAEVHLAVGDPDSALKQARRAKRAADQLGDVRAEAKAWVVEANAHTNMGNPLEGVKVATEALGLCQKSGDRLQEAKAWLAVAGAREMSKSQAEDIIGPLNKALAIYRQENERGDEAATLNRVGQVQLNFKPQEALLQAKESMTIFRNLGVPQGEAQALYTIVKAHVAKEEPQDALRVVKDRMSTASKKEQVLFTPAAAAAHLGSDDTDEALAAASSGLEIAQDEGDRRGEGWMHYTAAEVYLAKEKVESAVSSAHDALDAFQEVGDKLGESSAQAVLTAAYTMNNQAHKAPHRTVGLEQLGRLVEAIVGRNKQLFYDAFEKLNSSLGVDQQDFDSVLKPIFKKDSEAEDFYKENSYAFYGMTYEKETTGHLKRAKNVDRLEMFLGQRFGSMGYGPSFRSVQATWRKGDPYTIGSGTHALSILQDETKENWEEVAMFQAHPGMMDAALQVQGIPHARN